MRVYFCAVLTNLLLTRETNLYVTMSAETVPAKKITGILRLPLTQVHIQEKF